MATLMQPLSAQELKQSNLVSLRKDYTKLSNFYQKIINGEITLCPKCGDWKSTKINFYASNTSADGIEHYGCRECILNECTDYDRSTNTRIDNREKTIETFKRLDWYFDEKVYNDQLKILADGVGEKVRGTAAQQWIVMRASLNDYKNKTFADSVFLDEDGDEKSESDVKIIRKTLKTARKRFGNYSDEDLMFLENEYQDWITRYDCSQKAQEETFQNLSIIKLMKRNAIKKGLSTKDLDASYQQWLDTGNLKPKQNSLDTFSDAQTMGTLIQKYEETRPLPEIDPELADVDKIGLYIDAFYRGHASKMLGLKNRFSNIYEKVMSKYTVKPPSYDEESDSEILFDKIFGAKEDE